MGEWTRQELEDAFARYQEVGAECGASGNWAPWADLFAEDAEYYEHFYGKFRGREAIRDWIVKTMGEFPGSDMPEVPIGWYVIDDERGWVVCEVWNRMRDPGDGSIHEAVNFTLLKYAGNGLWAYEEDIYNPANFGEMLKGWTKAKRAAEAATG